MLQLIRTCLAESNMHGLPFLVDRRLSRAERIVWLLCLCASVALAFYTGRTQWQRYKERPIVLTIETDYMAWQLLRPAVTLCHSSFNETLAAELIQT